MEDEPISTPITPPEEPGAVCMDDKILLKKLILIVLNILARESGILLVYAKVTHSNS